MTNMRKMTMKMKKKKATTTSSAPKKAVKTGKWKEGDPCGEPKPFSKTKAPKPPTMTLGEYTNDRRNKNIKQFACIDICDSSNDLSMDFSVHKSSEVKQPS